MYINMAEHDTYIHINLYTYIYMNMAKHEGKPMIPAAMSRPELGRFWANFNKAETRKNCTRPQRKMGVQTPQYDRML